MNLIYYGSDRSGLVVPSLIGAFDVMRFSGEHVDRVSDVRATVVTATLLRYPAVTTRHGADQHQGVLLVLILNEPLPGGSGRRCR